MLFIFVFLIVKIKYSETLI